MNTDTEKDDLILESLVNRAHYEAVMNGSASGRPAAARGPVWSVAA